MCGITGFTGKPNKEILQKMNDTLKHRGPDGEGFFESNEYSLAMRRLAIIDLATGNQPMFSEDKTIAAVFNGEIYNFQDLRKELEDKHKFKTRSDTEVIVHGYEDWGTEVFAKFNGMFGIAIWDDKEKKLILARDRMGKKPVYYTVVNSPHAPSLIKEGGRGSSLVFGSEIKAILQHPQVKKTLSLEALNLYLTYEYVPGPLTIYQNIYKLPPGSYLIWQNGDFSIRSYWSLDFRKFRGNFEEAEYLAKFDQLMDDAVRLRLVADVPLGVFVSGGIDSGTIAYYAQRNTKDKIKTFSIGFTDPSFDESEYARLVAEFLGTEHYQEKFTQKDVLDLLADIIRYQDEPFGDASLFPTHLLSKFTRKHVTVALSGDGGDELLYGYPTFQMHKISEYYFKFPEILRTRVISKIIQNLPTSFNNITLDYGLKRFDASTKYPDWQRDQVWIGSFTDQEKALLFTKEVLREIDLDKTYKHLERYLHEVPGEVFLDKVSYLYLKNYLVDDILYKTDRASMYASLEARDPFMDYRIVEFLTSLPPELKMKGLKTKYLLKKLMSGKLPQKIVNRKKKGFGMPVAKWLLGELRDLVRENILDEKFINEQRLFDYEYLKMLWRQHESRKKDNRKQLWTLLMFQLWYRNYLNPSS